MDQDSLLDVLGQPLAREILVAVSREPRTAEELAEGSDASLPTVYRHANALVEHGLLTEETAVNTDGNNYQVYAPEAGRVRVTVTADGVETVVCEESEGVEPVEPVRLEVGEDA